MRWPSDWIINSVVSVNRVNPGPSVPTTGEIAKLGAPEDVPTFRFIWRVAVKPVSSVTVKVMV